MSLHNNNRAFTLIEMVAFIVVIGIAMAILVPMTVTLQHVHKLDDQTIATEITQQRMELILAQRASQGFSNTSDPCAGGGQSPACTVPSGFSINSTISSSWQGDSNFKEITVTTSGKASATLT